MDISKLPSNTSDQGGRIIFCTRLWNPDNSNCEREKERRRIQNKFRISTCKILKSHFSNVITGIYPDTFSEKQCPELLLTKKEIAKKVYFQRLKNSNIGIADDGLLNTPGWKIGEYSLFGLAIISTPITVVTNDFLTNENYYSLSSRTAFDEVPDMIRLLQTNKAYLDMGMINLEWSRKKLHPQNYLSNLIPNEALY
ncbi:hypothetical protein [Leeuwenhoekiella sp. W20_SRS_FM14]|uniref:hypothetical protein n=1 Tax=Leeuwenhoekiella sp. W20_SRS_FM14 TaxID=3240270 RepID=UPI003F9DE8C0